MKTIHTQLFKALAFCILLSSCGPDPVDLALDRYNEIVTKWEIEKSERELTFSDLTAIQQEFLNAKVDPRQIMHKSDINEEQQKRALRLSQRINNLMMPY
jgi:hypothetical protein